MAAFRKSVKGNDNEANEEFSHNRITVNFNGAGPLIFVLFVAGLITSAIIWLVIHFGGLLLLSLLALWIVAALGSIWLLGVWVYARTGIMLSERRRAHNLERFLSAPSAHHSIYLADPQASYTLHEISANVVAAGVPRVLPAPVEEEPLPPNEQDIIDVYNDGVSTLEQVADAFGLKYNKVQRIIARAKEKGLIARK